MITQNCIENGTQKMENERTLMDIFRPKEIKWLNFGFLQILLDEKVISPDEYRTAINTYLNKKMAIPQFNASILSNENQQRDKARMCGQEMSVDRCTVHKSITILKNSGACWFHIVRVTE